MRSFVVFIAVLAVALAVPMQDSGESGEAEAEWAMAEGGPGDIMEPIMKIIQMVMPMFMSPDGPPTPPQMMGMAGRIVDMIAPMFMPMIKEMSEGTQVCMTTEGDKCSSPPPADQMMQCTEAMQVACKNAAPGDTVYMCMNPNQMGMNMFMPVQGTCDMRLGPSGMVGFLLDFDNMLMAAMQSMAMAMGPQ